MRGEKVGLDCVVYVCVVASGFCASRCSQGQGAGAGLATDGLGEEDTVLTPSVHSLCIPVTV